MNKQLIKIALFAIFFIAAQNIPAQGPPPPPGGGHNLEGDAPAGGGTAPIGSGMLLLITMAAGYGVKKVYDKKEENRD
ncbi:MAG: hypothetical protein CVU14_06310 [Bacteroidetes bacterium HGW-Bacteroidetes-9]|jgi:hypothetical protein|nr:MAG: hypothetical protein CVU14_06310 [Bacteroidetes bacterium HGW-Bacteroidetes-9]